MERAAAAAAGCHATLQSTCGGRRGAPQPCRPRLQAALGPTPQPPRPSPPVPAPLSKPTHPLRAGGGQGQRVIGSQGPGGPGAGPAGRHGCAVARDPVDATPHDDGGAPQLNGADGLDVGLGGQAAAQLQGWQAGHRGDRRAGWGQLASEGTGGQPASNATGSRLARGWAVNQLAPTGGRPVQQHARTTGAAAAKVAAGTAGPEATARKAWPWALASVMAPRSARTTASWPLAGSQLKRHPAPKPRVPPVVAQLPAGASASSDTVVGPAGRAQAPATGRGAGRMLRP